MNEMLGRLIRLLVMVPGEMLGAVCDLAEKLASQRGGEWYEQFLLFLQRKPCWSAIVKKYLNRLPVSDPTAVWYAMVADGLFKEILENVSRDRWRWQRSEMEKFCHTHFPRLREGCHFFFELKEGIIAHVTLGADHLRIDFLSTTQQHFWEEGVSHFLLVPRFWQI